MNRAVIGILAHVDSGKTTLSEALLYQSGALRKMGRVDHKNTFLDTNAMERDRGITIFSKQAIFSVGSVSFTLIDTPGHVDFSAETERTLQILDAAILVISGTDGVQSHTETLWKLLQRYQIPVFVFVNKMDMSGADLSLIQVSLSRLSDRCIPFSAPRQVICETASLCSETLMNEFLETGELQDETLKEQIASRSIFPCWYGSALHMDGVDSFLEGLVRYVPIPSPKDTFGASVYKIEEGDNRLTYLKVTGGCLQVRDLISYTADGNDYSEKINRIQIFHGEKAKAVPCAEQGTICAVSGLSKTYVGQGLGTETDSAAPLLTPVLSYRVKTDGDLHTLLGNLRKLEAEDPQLHVIWNEQLQELHIQLMGEIQLEILKRVLADRFGSQVSFDTGSIAYRETIAEPVMGYGHYEPLRHFADVQLRLEPLPTGSGLEFCTACSEDILSRNWQRLIQTHLQEKTHLGVLTGSPITDMRITLVYGKAHLKHTEGGDFRQATYRAVRQGLRSANSILLEPYYAFRLEIPPDSIGRALLDLQTMHADFVQPEQIGQSAVICGSAPVSELRDYHSTLASYTRGEGRLSCTLKGYAPCHNPEEVIAAIGYDCDGDLANTADSVYCSHGAGHLVPWYEIAEKHQSEKAAEEAEEDPIQLKQKVNDYCRRVVEDEELMKIFERTYGPIRREKRQAMRREPEPSKQSKPRPQKFGTEYLLVDGYNIIFAWSELKTLAEKSLDLARSKLIQKLCNYQGIRQCELILVFDAYRTGEPRRIERCHNINVVYTQQAETADTYIERTAHQLSANHRVRVATSDGMEQTIILGSGAFRVSAAELQMEIKQAEDAIRAWMQTQ